jgi:NAD(P)-dependent dehydrogenase (short-subunit alcohol dehydrogenase family)
LLRRRREPDLKLPTAGRVASPANCTARPATECFDPSSVAELAEHAADATIVVNNAGIPLRTPLVTVDIDAVREAFDTNAFGPLRVAQHFIPVLARNGGGAQINISSVMAWAAGAATYGPTEVLVDDDSRRAKRLLSGPPEGLEYTLTDGHMVFNAETTIG